MKKADFHDIETTISGDPNQGSTLILEIDHFRKWLNTEWTILKWEEMDLENTAIPRFVFSIMVPVDDGIATIEGEIDNNEWKRVTLFDASYKFVAIFMRKLKNNFPENADIHALISGYSYVKISEKSEIQSIETTDNEDILGKVLVDPGLEFLEELGEL